MGVSRDMMPRTRKRKRKSKSRIQKVKVPGLKYPYFRISGLPRGTSIFAQAKASMLREMKKLFRERPELFRGIDKTRRIQTILAQRRKRAFQKFNLRQ